MPPRIDELKLDGDPVLLGPLDKAGLEVLLGLDQIVEVEALFYQAVDDKSAAALVALIQVHGADECLQRIAADVAVVGRRVHHGPHVAVEVQRVADAVEALALDDLGARGGQEALVLGGVSLVEEIGDYGVEDGVAQVFQPLVIGPASVGHLHGLGTVYHGQLVELDVVRIVAGGSMNKNIKLLILDEKELYE